MSKLLKTLQEVIKVCVREGNAAERDIFKTVVGEIQTVQTRTGKMTDDGVIKILKKFKAGVQETILAMNGAAPDEMYNEIKLYDKYIPATMSVTEIVVHLTGKSEIYDAKSDGQATGVAMKILKGDGCSVNGKDVSEAVKSMRNS